MEDKKDKVFGDLFNETRKKALERAYHPKKDKKSKQNKISNNK